MMFRIQRKEKNMKLSFNDWISIVIIIPLLAIVTIPFYIAYLIEECNYKYGQTKTNVVLISLIFIIIRRLRS